MLGVSRVRDGTGRYYLAGLDTDVPLGGPQPDAVGGWWVGTGAFALGLHGRIRAGSFQAVLEGRNPSSRCSLALRRGASVMGYDLTFSAPKGVSALFALGQASMADQVLEAHHQAVRAATSYIERFAAAVRRGPSDDVRVVRTDGLIGAAFTHFASRASDPHLHTHVVLANLAHGEDRWSALDGRGLFAHAAAAGELYEAHLRHGLASSSSIEWERGRQGRPQIAGLDPVVIGIFSNRSAEIRMHLDERGLRSRRARRIAWATTRDPAVAGPGVAELRMCWAERARRHGVGPLELRWGSDRGHPLPRGLDEHRFAAELYRSPHGVRRRDVIRAWSRSLLQGAPAREIQGAVEHWLPGVEGIGVAEPLSAIGPLIPGSHLLRALGPRPLQAAQQPLWRAGAEAIEAYRSRWGIGVRDPLLDLADRRPLRDLPARQVADHLTLCRHLGELRAQLGRARDPTTGRGGLELGHR